jgi:hypothetical protein
MGAYSSRLEGERQNTKGDKCTSQTGSDYKTTGNDTKISAQLLFLDDLMQTKFKKVQKLWYPQDK